MESLALSIPRSLLVVALSAPAVGFAVALWLWPVRALSRFSLRQAPWSILSLCRPSCTVSLLTVSVIGARFDYAVGRSPHAFGPIGALGELRWLHLCRLTPDLVGLRRFATWLWSSGRCLLFFLCDFPHVSMALYFVSFPDSCVSIPHFYLGCSSLDSCLDEWLGGLCPPPLSSRILSFEWSYSPDSLILLHPAIDFVAVSLSPSLTYALTPGHCVPLGGLHVLVGSSTYPSLGCLLGPSSIGLWLCWRLGCRPVPSSHFLDSVSYLACSLDCCSYGFLRWT